MTDGENDGKGGRYCAAHGSSHGTLYECPLYTSEVRERVAALNAQFKANLQDPKWIAEQRANGIPQTAIDIFKIFGGGVQ
ncbi:MAG TPA: hypothetical protein VJU58_06130 [Microbacterium sp.]|nr:hypothetical protein [Microbacterium sp.]